MRKSLFYSLLTLLILSMAFTACKKDEDEDNNNNNNTPVQQDQNLTPQIDDADGLLAALTTTTFQDNQITGPLAIDIDVGLAAFFDGTNFFDAGNVTVNDSMLDKLSNNSYISASPSGTSVSLDLGFSSSSQNTWVVQGSSPNVTGFTHTTSRNMPSNIEFDGDYGTVDISGNVTISIKTVPTNADSMLFHIVDNQGVSVLVTTEVKKSHTFAASELSGLTPGDNSLIQVAAYNFESEMYDGKKIYFINEVVISELLATLN